MAGHALSEVILRANMKTMPCLKRSASINTGFKTYCNVCSSSVDKKRSNHIKHHIERKKHIESVVLKRPRQPNIEAVSAKKGVEDNFNRDFTKMWIGAGLPLLAISGELKVFMETQFGRKTP